MITTKNITPYKEYIRYKKDRAAHLVQAMEKCPLEDTLVALTIFDKWNSQSAKSPSAKRWIRQFCGFESKSELIVLMEGMPDVA